METKMYLLIVHAGVTGEDMNETAMAGTRIAGTSHSVQALREECTIIMIIIIIIILIIIMYI